MALGFSPFKTEEGVLIDKQRRIKQEVMHFEGPGDPPRVQHQVQVLPAKSVVVRYLQQFLVPVLAQVSSEPHQTYHKLHVLPVLRQLFLTLKLHTKKLLDEKRRH